MKIYLKIKMMASLWKLGQTTELTKVTQNFLKNSDGVVYALSLAPEDTIFYLKIETAYVKM